MEFAVVVFAGLFALVCQDFLAPKALEKTPEQELGDAISKYLSEGKRDK